MAHADMTEAVGGEVGQPPRRSRLAAIEHALGMLVEIPAALLVVAEIVILFAGVVARYALHRPLIWSDELASILFLSVAAVIGMFWYALPYLSPLPVPKPDGWLGALAVGSCLAALFGFLRLAQNSKDRLVVGAIMSVVAVVGLFWLAQPYFRPLGNLNLIIFFVGVAGFCVFAGVPIAFGFGLATYGYLALTTGTPLMVLVGRVDERMSHLILLSVPLFVFLGLLIEMTGMARAMVAFLASLLGHIRGGLHYVLVGAMYLVSGISGSKAADMAAIAPALFPEMKKRGAKPGDLVALLSATGAQTGTIPPSLVLITIGSVTGVSIAALFTGGLLPGLVLAITLSALVWWRYRGEDLRHVTRASAGEIARAFSIALPAIALPFVIRYAVVEGIATATEVSNIDIDYSLLVVT